MTLKTREKILITVVVIAVAIWAFDRFYYTPQKAKILRLKNEVRTADLKLRESQIFAVAVEKIGIIPMRFNVSIRKKKLQNNGAIFLPSFFPR